MTTRLYNAKILSMIDNQDIFDGEIQVTDNKITYIGNYADDSKSVGSKAASFDKH